MNLPEIYRCREGKMGNAQPVIFRISIHIRWYLPDISNTQNINAGVGVSKKGKGRDDNWKFRTWNEHRQPRSQLYISLHPSQLPHLRLRPFKPTFRNHIPSTTQENLPPTWHQIQRLRICYDAAPKPNISHYLSNCTREPSTLRDTGFVPGTGMNRINFDEQNVFRAK